MAFPTPALNTTARGYGADHQKARAAAALVHKPTDPCARCHKPLGRMSPALHYDHNGKRTGYLGFSHADCNRTAGAREGRRRQTKPLPRLALPLKTSRAW